MKFRGFLDYREGRNAHDINRSCVKQVQESYIRISELRHTAFADTNALLMIVHHAIPTTHPGLALVAGDIGMSLWLQVFLNLHGESLSPATREASVALFSKWAAYEAQTEQRLQQWSSSVREACAYLPFFRPSAASKHT
jgi:hypothetical protein